MFDYEKLTDEQLRFFAEIVDCPFLIEDTNNNCDNCSWVNDSGCVPYKVYTDAVGELINRGKL